MVTGVCYGSAAGGCMVARARAPPLRRRSAAQRQFSQEERPNFPEKATSITLK